MSKTLSPTAEQAAIIEAAGSSPASLMISAFAGTAKTTTIEMLSKNLRAPSILALAFNVKIKQELEKRLPAHFIVKTMNGLGHSAWATAIGKRLTLETSKLAKLITQVAKANHTTLEKEEWVNVKDLVTAARTAGLVPNTFPQTSFLPDTPASWADLAEANDISVSPALIDLARAILVESIRMAYAGVIDFDDQIYMSVCFGGVFPRFHTVIVDEAQDLSTMNHVMLRKCCTHRLIVCGDPAQSLYAFRGAATDSMGKIRGLRPDWIDLPLTLTFRCPRAIVYRQQHHVPGYRAANSNADGLVMDWQEKGPGEEGTWDWSNVPQSGTTAVLCRNNAPIITLAFRLLRRRIGVMMLGRDLGKGLIATIKKLPTQDSSPINEVAAALVAWKDREASIFRANGNDSGLEKLHDRYESIMAVVESSSSNNQAALCSAIADLFAKDRGLVTLATAHRAKGLEWDHVVHLDPFRIPSKWAKSPEALRQEANAEYVLETRAKHTLILANLESFR